MLWFIYLKLGALVRIWYINPYAGGPGVGRYWRAYSLAKEWVSLGHEVTVVSPSYHHLMTQAGFVSRSHEVDGVIYNFVPSVKYEGNGFWRLVSMLIFGPSFFIRALFRLHRERPRLIIYSSAHPFGYPWAWVLARLFGAKIFFEVRDIWPLSLIEIAGLKPRHPIVILLGLIERFAYRSADRVVSLLPNALSHMRSKGVASEKYLYVPNGVSLEAFAGKINYSFPLVEKIYALRNQGYFIFVYTGALGEPNAMHRFVDSLQYLEPRVVDRVRFFIVGRGEQEKEIKERCVELGYDFVSFHPQVDKSAVVDILRVADAGFFLTNDLPIYRFGISPNKMFDYMAAQLPFVGVYRSSGSDIISSSGCGINVLPDAPKELAAAFAKIATYDGDALKEMGRKGGEWIAKHYEYKVLARTIIDAAFKKDQAS